MARGAKPGQRFGGRKKGSVNGLTKEARQIFYDTLEGLVPKIKPAFDKVFEENPEKALDLFSKYAAFFMPKKVDITSDGNAINTPLINWVIQKHEEQEEEQLKEGEIKILNPKENVKKLAKPKRKI